MSLFNPKQKATVEECCKNFYESIILAPTVGDSDVSNIFYEVSKRSIEESNSSFSKIGQKNFLEELTVLQFELFSLAWTHKFISGKAVVSQSDFTKRFLHEKGKDQIWIGMEKYNNVIDGATLHWLANLGKMNLSFNYGMRNDLSSKNVEEAQKIEIENDDRVERANNRTWSENAWNQRVILGPLVFTLCGQLSISPEDLNDKAKSRLAMILVGIYDGAKQYLDKVKIIDK